MQLAFFSPTHQDKLMVKQLPQDMVRVNEINLTCAIFIHAYITQFQQIGLKTALRHYNIPFLTHEFFKQNGISILTSQCHNPYRNENVAALELQ